MTAATDACHATTDASCRWVKPSVFNSARSCRRRRTDAGEGEAQSDDRTGGEPRRQQGRGDAHGAVVHDLRRTLDAQHRHVVALPAAVGDGGKGAVGDVGDVLQVGKTGRGRDAVTKAHEDQLGADRGWGPELLACWKPRGRKLMETSAPVPMDV